MSIQSIYSSTPQAAAHAAASSSNSSTSSSSSSSSTDGLDPTFMSLLLAELQTQDPTAPMDTTEMVGQMVSLNQLDELVSIQGILQNSLGSLSSTGSASTSGDSSNGSSGSTSQQQAIGASSSAAQAAATTAQTYTNTNTPSSNAMAAYSMIAGVNPASNSQSMYGAN